MLLPTYQKRYQVYLGIVIRPRRLGKADRRQNTQGYYYHFDIAGGDWYDNAHRVDVDWAKPEAGMFSTFDIPEVGGTWIRGFGQVQSGVRRIARLAEAAGLIQYSRRSGSQTFAADAGWCDHEPPRLKCSVGQALDASAGRVWR